ncbi:cation transporter [Euhalothece natronophila Z-M001]|uniref:Cation transporter n=1 Tax=Euhalothece natronophila Z-M001 TaxID=522448 RepID=A0A5B8NL05_9CHRO|nr:cation diffusion facilitator family transporter [Euhalothece natronophila]QDZ38960.1 cation transporter [Euhalothece natronophila Z-M001]
MTKVDHRPEVRRVLIITLILNIIVMGLKLVVGFLTGALSLQADALHSFTDAANNVLGLVSNQFASPQPDRDHPYGHQKFEALGALGIAAFLGITCFEIIQRSIERIFTGVSPITLQGWELWLLILVLGVNIFIAFYERHVGKKLNNRILIADSYHTMGDIWTTIVIVAGLVGIWQGARWDIPELQWLDVVLAFPVALLVFKSAWEVLKENLPWLVDEAAIPPEVIHRITLQVPGVINCHDIASRGVVGQQVFIEMHMIVDANDLETAHKITEAVEEKLKTYVGPARVVIHMEPPRYQSDTITFSEPNDTN